MLLICRLVLTVQGTDGCLNQRSFKIQKKYCNTIRHQKTYYLKLNLRTVKFVH